MNNLTTSGSPKNVQEKDMNACMNKIKHKIEHSIGHLNNAPHFSKDDEFLLHGYRINFFTF